HARRHGESHRGAGVRSGQQSRARASARIRCAGSLTARFGRAGADHDLHPRQQRQPYRRRESFGSLDDQRLRCAQPPDATARYAYDPPNNLTQVTDPRNNTTTHTFDGLNNLVGLTSPDTGVSTSTYDPAGNLKTRIDARGVTATHTVDPIDRVTKIVYSKAGT